MKIDMLTIMNNQRSTIEANGNKSEEKFLSVLDNKIGDDTDNEVIGCDSEKSEDELLTLIAELFIKLNNDKSFNVIDSKDILGSIVSEELNNYVDIKQLFSKNELVNILKDMNITEENIKSINNEFYIALGKNNNLLDSELKLNDLKNTMKNNEINNNLLEIITEDNKLLHSNDLSLENIDLDNNTFLKEIKNVISEKLNAEIKGDNTKMLIQDIYKLNDIKGSVEYSNYFKNDKNESYVFEINNLKFRNILKDESTNNDNSELNILNSIAYSNNHIEANIQEIQPHIARTQYLSQDILQSVKYLNSNNIEELTLKITPKDLGEMTIKLLKLKNESKLVITSTNLDAFKLINENINEIRSHLNSLDIKVKEVFVEIKNDNQSNFSDNLNQQFNRNNSREERKNKFTKIQSKDREINPIGDDENINILI